MKAFILGLCLLFWIIMTVILTVSIFGMISFLPEDAKGESYWFVFGKNLLEKI